jgi:hypothetical protein
VTFKLKDRCGLSLGDSFLFRGEYCTVIGFKYKHFIYSIQGRPKVKGYMDYQFYLTTPSAKGRRIKTY